MTERVCVVIHVCHACYHDYSVFQKSNAKIEITITATNLIRIKYLLAALIITFLVQTLQISTKSTAPFLSNSCLSNGTQK